ncbi:MAG TPA: bifunctional DNA-binding transcriptional regulator/O6-methylguanine-DNA methyltransferase Ada [Terracidiphilus sp.]|nr:bifunctional DNA-binding transcriptional regulator/O6-methylguanine-DNA methyltransferase Ada [Terracidiphilus sp.]
MTTNVQFATLEPTTNMQSIDEEQAWQQLCDRDRNGKFFYAVTTTGVFCRSDCKSRRPLRENVRFFASASEAQAAGFRPCKRCKPTARRSNGLDKVRAYLELHVDRPVPLAELARVVGMSPFTVQRAFKQEMGVSPLQYQRSLRAGRLRGALKQSDRVTDAIYEAGFGSSSRAYEGSQLGMTPARFAQGGKGERIGWCSAKTPFGWVIVGATGRGLCWLSLAATAAEAEASLRTEFPAAELHRDPSLSKLVDDALASVRDGSDLTRSGSLGGPLDLRGTVFQLRVWQALRQIPRGETRSYSEVARQIGEPNANRAVARACAVNRVAIIVPCHRVVGADGSATGYRWGVERKQQLLAAEKVGS